jgi:hypothetical protein
MEILQFIWGTALLFLPTSIMAYVMVGHLIGSHLDWSEEEKITVAGCIGFFGWAAVSGMIF